MDALEAHMHRSPLFISAMFVLFVMAFGRGLFGQAIDGHGYLAEVGTVFGACAIIAEAVRLVEVMAKKWRELGGRTQAP